MHPISRKDLGSSKADADLNFIGTRHLATKLYFSERLLCKYHLHLDLHSSIEHNILKDYDVCTLGHFILFCWDV